MNLIDLLHKFPELPKILERALALFTKPTETPPIAPPAHDISKDDLPRIRVYNEAYALLGKDLSQQAPDDRGCAESLSRVLQRVYPNFPIMLSTTNLYQLLKASVHFKEIYEPQQGCVAIFPTEGTKIGHCGVWGKRNVLNNNSHTGFWDATYTHNEWLAEAKKRGLTNHFFLPL